MIDPKKFIIGTAQFGTDYGITNFYGKTRISEIKKIIKEADRNNIYFYDTAPVYGNAEKILGRFSKKINVITKLKNINEKRINLKNIELIKKNFYKSLKNLNLKKIYALLIHSTKDITKDNSELLVGLLKDLKKKGIVKKIGVSIYEKKDFDNTLKVFKPDLIQIPISIADQRLLYKNFIKKIKKMNIEIHARSIFLQGILISNKNKLPIKIKKKFNNYLVNFNKKLKKEKIAPIQACLNFVNSINEIDKIVLGINSLEHLKEILRNNKKEKINKNIFNTLKFKNSHIINPNNWPNDV